MYIQIINQTLNNNNQHLIKITDNIAYQTFMAIKQRGWNVRDCISKQVHNKVIRNVYRGPDGKNLPMASKQYKVRARVLGTLNMKKDKVIMASSAA